MHHLLLCCLTLITSPANVQIYWEANRYQWIIKFLCLYLKCVAGELLAGERNLNCPDAENPCRNTEPFCQNSKGEWVSEVSKINFYIYWREHHSLTCYRSYCDLFWRPKLINFYNNDDSCSSSVFFFTPLKRKQGFRNCC